MLRRVAERVLDNDLVLPLAEDEPDRALVGRMLLREVGLWSWQGLLESFR
jgi:hypothetical protein